MPRNTPVPLQQYRGTTAQHAVYTGPAGEITIDTTKKTLVVQDGVTAGGHPLAKESTTITASNGVEISAGGTLGQNTTVSGVSASTSAPGVVQLNSATNSTSQTQAATPKAVSDALAEAKTYADTAGNYTGSAPIAVDQNSHVISAADATTSSKGVVQVGENVDVSNGEISVKPWAVYEADHTDVTVADLQDGCIVQTAEPLASETAVLAEVEQTLSGSQNKVPSSLAVKTAMDAAYAPVYVDAATGNDANDGLTAETAVKTITRAVNLAAQRQASSTHLHIDCVWISIAPGTYTENVEVNCRAIFSSTGTVTINGSVSAVRNGVLLLGGQNSYNITATSAIAPLFAAFGGELVIQPNTSVRVTVPSGVSPSYAVAAAEHGHVAINGSLTIAAPGLSATGSVALTAYSNATISIGVDAVGIVFESSSRAELAIQAYISSLVVFYGGTITINGTYSIIVRGLVNGVVRIPPNVVLNGSPTGIRYRASNGGVVYTEGGGANRIPGSAAGGVDAATYGVYA